MPLRTVPVLHDLNREFWTAGNDNELRLPHCEACGFWSYPPGPICPRCRRRALRWETTSGSAVLFTYTHNWKPWNPEVPVPYTIGIVELPEQSGLRMTSNIVHCEPSDVFIGMPLRVVFERQGEYSIPLFEPDGPAPAGKSAVSG